MSEPLTALDRLWDAMWEDLRHNATCRPSGLAIIATHRPAIEAEVRFEAARTTALDVERLARAMRWAGIRCEPEYATVEDAARQLAGDYASPMTLAALAEPKETP